MNRRSSVSLTCIVILCSGSAITLFTNLHPWYWALLVWVFSSPWIGFVSYLFGRTDEQRIRLDQWVKSQDEEIQEMLKCEALLKTKTRIKFP